MMMKRSRRTDSTESRIRNAMVSKYSESERKYYNRLDHAERSSIATTEGTVIKENIDQIPLRFRVLLSNMDPNLKAISVKKLNFLSTLDESSTEYFRTMSFVESMTKLPFGLYKNVEYGGDPSKFLKHIQSELDRTVYGHKDAKNHIVRVLAKWITNPTSKGVAIGLGGKKGVGKTLLCSALAKILGLPFGFVPLGGASAAGSSFLLGHEFTYQSAKWGKIADIVMKAGVMNPVIFFDELDKVSGNHHGQDVINTLIHLTDSTQNNDFHDLFFSGVPLDMSRCLMLFSYNDVELINPILRDRMVCIDTPSYSLKDKVAIARNFLIPDVLKQYSMTAEDVVLSDEILQYLTTIIPTEEGVRTLRRAIDDIVSHVNLEKMMGRSVGPITVDRKVADKFVMRGKVGNQHENRMYT